MLALLLVATSAQAHPDAPPKVSADMVILNAKIWTGDPTRPEVEALAAWGGRILAVGTTGEMKTLVGPKTTIVDARGRRIVPGFHDSHVHVLMGGMRLNQVALKDAANGTEFGKRLAEFDKKLSRGSWMIGGEWDHDHTFAGKLPTAADIDAYVKDRPVLIRRYDGHMALANTAALARAGITANTPDPSGGVIYRDPETKKPTGLLRDNAMDLVERLVPPPTEEEIAAAVKAALAEAAENGITSLTDMEGSDSATRRRLLKLHQRLARQGKLTARMEVRWPIADWEELAKLAIEADFGGDFLRVGGLKGYIDGSLGSSTAKFDAPYVNEPTSTGVFVTPRERMLELVTGADRAGLSVAVHAIGDRGNAEMLDIFEEAQKRNGPRDRRFRIEHAQHVRPADFARFAGLNVVASMQPFHVIDDGRWAVGRIGEQRCRSSYAYRSMLDAGARLAFGSDWSVAPLNPLVAIDAAVNRRTLDGKYPGGWFAEQRITVAEAIAAYTQGSAYASHQELERGSIAVGKFADCVILSGDLLAENERGRLGEIKVLATIVGGRVVHDVRPDRP